MITQILLNNLDSDNNRISYRRDWNKITGSVTATILLQQVYYWYKINDYKPFYKFKCAPSKPHKLYNPDKPDDWCTELGFTEREFDGALKKIGFKYTQKTKDEKHNMLVEYWTDSSRVTHYKLNMVNFLCALMDLYLTNNLSVTKTTKSDLANLQNDIYVTYKLDFTKSTKSDLPITDTTTDTNSDTTTEENAPKVAPQIIDQPEKKETPKRDSKKSKRKKIAPKKEIKKPPKEKPEIHLAMDKMNERYVDWCKVRGIDDSDKIDFTPKECKQLSSLIRKIRSVAKDKKFEYRTNTDFINGAFNEFLTAYIFITKSYQGAGAGWYTSSFKPSQMVSNYQEIRDTFKLIRNGKGKSNGVTDDFKQKQFDILNRAKRAYAS